MENERRDIVPSAPPLNNVETDESVAIDITSGGDEYGTGGDETKECTICLEDVEENDKYILIDCDCRMNKLCHSECVLKWLQKNSVCPICSKPISASQVFSNHSIDSDELRERDTGDVEDVNGCGDRSGDGSGNDSELRGGIEVDVPLGDEFMTAEDRALTEYAMAFERRRERRRERLQERRRAMRRRFTYEEINETEDDRAVRQKRNCFVGSIIATVVVYFMVNMEMDG